MAINVNAASAATTAAAARDTASSTSSKTTNALETPSKEMFLQLLVAQIKNQDPLNPSDGTQFLTQLAQFSELEQLIGIREGISSLNTSAAKAATSSTTA